MQPEHSQPAISRRTSKWRRCRALLVGCGQVPVDRSAAEKLDGHLLQVVDKSRSLLGALEKLDTQEIDVVLMESEFTQEELELFVLDARRRGFLGTVLHVVAGASQIPGSYLQPKLAVREPQHGERRTLDPAVLANDKLNDFFGLISFTEKERAVLTRVSRGWTNLEIARDLKCSEGSVKAILQQLFNKLGVRKRAQIVRMAFERGFSASPIEARRSSSH